MQRNLSTISSAPMKQGFMVRLRIGYIGSELGIATILSQEKPDFSEFEPGSRIGLQDYSCIIVCSALNSVLLESVRRYIEQGGSALTTIETAQLFDKTLGADACKIRYIAPKGELFRNTGLLWLDMQGFVAKGPAQGLVNGFAGAVVERQLGKGHYIALPFNPNDAILDTRSAERGFEFSGPAASEVVSAVSKGGVRQLVSNCLARLHELQGFPYLHLWYFPDSAKGVFAFRVDVDEWGDEDVRRTLDIAIKEKLRMCWALNTGHEKYSKGVVEDLKEAQQEIRSHGFMHNVFESKEKNIENMNKAYDVILKSGVSLEQREFSGAFIAPFGKWNPALAEATEEIGCKYGSEFALDFDDLPFRPLVNGKTSSVLQVPVHPMCINRLLTRNYTPGMMENYFRNAVDRLYDSAIPVFLYGHPTKEIGKYPQVIEAAISHARKKPGMLFTSLGEFADWWNEREKVFISVFYEEGAATVIIKGPAERASLRLVEKGKQALVRASGRTMKLKPKEIDKQPLPSTRLNGLSVRITPIPLSKRLPHFLIMTFKRCNSTIFKWWHSGITYVKNHKPLNLFGGF